MCREACPAPHKCCGPPEPGLAPAMFRPLRADYACRGGSFPDMRWKIPCTVWNVSASAAALSGR